MIESSRINLMPSTSASAGFIHFEVYVDAQHIGNLYPNGLMLKQDDLFKEGLRVVRLEAEGYGWMFAGVNLHLLKKPFGEEDGDSPFR